MSQMWDNMALTKKVKDLETTDRKVRASVEEAKKETLEGTRLNSLHQPIPLHPFHSPSNTGQQTAEPIHKMGIGTQTQTNPTKTPRQSNQNTGKKIKNPRQADSNTTSKNAV